jgi:hypothetical protein
MLIRLYRIDRRSITEQVSMQAGSETDPLTWYEYGFPLCRALAKSVGYVRSLDRGRRNFGSTSAAGPKLSD